MKFPPENYSNKCPVCRLPAAIRPDGGNTRVDCSCCGDFSVTDVGVVFLSQREWNEEQAFKAAWFLRRNPGFEICSKSISQLEQLRETDVSQKGVSILVHLARLHPHPGDIISHSALFVNSALFKLRQIDKPNVYAGRHLTKESLEPLQLFSVSGCTDQYQLHWIIENYLMGLGYLKKGIADGRYEISLEGWRLIGEQSKSSTLSMQGFVAMPFAERFMPLYIEALHPGIHNAGYEPVRIDRHEHNNRIDDEIIAGIRRSRFVVADLSLHRGGIYFEAGYALGLGLPVVWTVERTALDNNEVHFDNRQYNFLVWEEGKYDDLARRLTNRIEATIGRPF